MHQDRRSFYIICFSAVFAVLMVSVSSVMASATSRTIELNFIRSNECTGELVKISGTVHMVSNTQPDGSVIGHMNYQGLTGLGLTSGIAYHVSAIDHFRLSDPFPSSIHSVRSIRLISEGASEDVVVHILYHITVDANGEVAVEFDNSTASC